MQAVGNCHGCIRSIIELFLSVEFIEGAIFEMGLYIRDLEAYFWVRAAPMSGDQLGPRNHIHSHLTRH